MGLSARIEETHKFGLAITRGRDNLTDSHLRSLEKADQRSGRSMTVPALIIHEGSWRNR